MINSSISIKKVLKLLFEISFYSIVFFLLFVSLGYINFNIKLALKSFLPTIFGMYWFATTYVVLYLISPFLNVLLKNIKKEEHISLIILLVTLWSLIPTLLTAKPAFSNLVWFITLYIIAAYIRLYPNYYFHNIRINISLFVIGYIFVLLSIICFDLIGLKIHIVGRHATYFIGMNMLPILVCAVALFLVFKNLSIKNNKIINRMAATMFGVYLIHDNRCVRPFLWQTLFHNNAYYKSTYLFLHTTMAILSVFFICIIIDMLRIKVVEEPSLKFLEKLASLINKRLSLLNAKLIRLTNRST